MPALKEDERWNPRYGVGDVNVIGDGIADFSKGYHNNFYMSLKMSFLEECLDPLMYKGDQVVKDGEIEKHTFATLEFSTNVDGLIEEGYSEEDAKEVAAAVGLLCKHINKRIVGSNPDYEKVDKWTGGPLLSQDGDNIIIHRKDE